MTDVQNDSETEQEDGELSAARRIKIALIAVGVVAALALLFLTVRGNVIPQESEVVEPVAEQEPAAVAPLDMRWVEIGRLPADLFGEDGEVIGSVFIEVGLAVGSAEDEAYLSERLDEVRLSILAELAAERISRQDEPLEIDRERVAAMIREAANQALGRALVLEVSVPESLEDG